MIDLEQALVDLAEHLDVPTGEHLVESVRGRLLATNPTVHEGSRRNRALLAAAAVFIVVILGVVAVAPAREAIADWLGIGAVEVRRGTPLPVATPTTRPRVDTLEEARGAVDFTISTPPAAVAGPLLAVGVDARVPGGLVSLRYRRFTLEELASARGGEPVIGKVVDPLARVEDVDVDGVPGLWISGAHEIGYLDRAGAFRKSTIRRSGPVLVWSRDGITYRVEGLASQAAAQAVAASMRPSAR